MGTQLAGLEHVHPVNKIYHYNNGLVDPNLVGQSLICRAPHAIQIVNDGGVAEEFAIEVCTAAYLITDGWVAAWTEVGSLNLVAGDNSAVYEFATKYNFVRIRAKGATTNWIAFAQGAKGVVADPNNY